MHKPRQYRGGYQSSRMADFARQQRKASTRAESVLWQALRNRRFRGLKFRRQHQIGDYVVDFFCSEARLVIECDGPIHTANETWQHDQVRDAYMISLGLRILRFTNNQVPSEMPLVLETIRKSAAKVEKRID